MSISVKILGTIWSPARLTEAALAEAFALNGREFFAHLDGEFALKIELGANEFYLVRDPIGLHPLYFREDDPRRFAAFMRDLVEGEPGLDIAAVQSCARKDRRPAEGAYAAPVKGLLTLAPGHFLHFKDGRIEVERYWTPWDTLPASSNSNFAQVLSDAVAKRVHGATKAALNFSGGFDSSALAATLKSLKVPTQLISQRFRESADADEGEYQQAVVKYLDLQWTTFFETDLPSCQPNVRAQVEASELPLAEPLFALFTKSVDEAIAGGAGVFLTGLWGDQMMVPLDALWECIAPWRWREGVQHWRALKRTLPEEDWGGYKRYLRQTYRRLLKRPLLSPRQEYFRRLLTSRYHVNCLEWNFKIGRARGIPVRSPFLDRSIIEFVLQATPKELFGLGHKTLLRSNFAEQLPEKVVMRKGKTDFSPVVRRIMSLGPDEPLWDKIDKQAMTAWHDASV